jgi:hypothetical protein
MTITEIEGQRSAVAAAAQDAHCRIEALHTERAALTVPAMTGDAAAQKQLLIIERQLADAERDQERVQLATGVLAERAQVAAYLEAEAQHAALLALVIEKVDQRTTVYFTIQNHIEAAVEGIRDALQLGGELHGLELQMGGHGSPWTWSQGEKQRIVNYLVWQLANAGLRPDISAPDPVLCQPLVGG